MTYVEYRELHGQKVRPGTFAAQQLLARWERDEEANKARTRKPAIVSELYCYATGALRHAIHILKLSRSSDRVRPSTFVGAFVRLEAFIEGLGTLKDRHKALRHWPKQPGFVFGGNSGFSVLEAVIAFSTSVYTGAVVGRALHRIPSHGEPYASQIAVDECGPDIAMWCTKAIEELSTKTCPSSHVWPTQAELHADVQSVGYKLQDEFNRAIRASKSNEMRHVLHDALSDCTDAIERYASLRPRLFDQIVSLSAQGDGPWNIRYKRDPANGPPSVKPKVVHQVSTTFNIEGIPLDAGVMSLQIPETYAPFFDFELFDSKGMNPTEGTESWRIGKRIQIILEQLLETAKQLMQKIEIIEREARRRGLRSNTTPLSKLAMEFPVFPYWTPPQGKTFKAMQKQDFDRMISDEIALLSEAKLSIRLLANEEAERLEQVDIGGSGSSEPMPDDEKDGPNIDQSVHFHGPITAQVVQTGHRARTTIKSGNRANLAQAVGPAYLDAFKIISQVSATDMANVPLPLQLPEVKVRRAFEQMLGESFHATDSGVESCDTFSLQGSHRGKQCTVAAMFKGSGNRSLRWPLQVAGCGKNGNQIVKLFEVPANVYIIQANGPLDPTLVKHIRDTADAHSARGRNVRFMLIDGVSTARLLRAADVPLT